MMLARFAAFLAIALAGAAATGIVAGAAGDESNLERRRNPAVIAVVNGSPVLLSAIHVSDDAAIARFTREHGRPPVGPSDLEQLETLRRGWETQFLASRIRGIIYDQTVRRLGIEVTHEEMVELWQRWRREKDGPSTLEPERAKTQALIKGLNAVYEDAKDPDDVYADVVQPLWSRKAWQAVLQQYRSRAMRVKLQQLAVQQESPTFEDVQDGLKRAVRMQKVERAIDQELVRTDPEFAEYVRLSETDPGNDRVRKRSPTYRLAKREEWWQERRREAKIEILDDRFADVRALLRK